MLMQTVNHTAFHNSGLQAGAEIQKVNGFSPDFFSWLKPVVFLSANPQTLVWGYENFSLSSSVYCF